MTADGYVRYIDRSIPEIHQLQQERRKGRPPTKREEALILRTETERKEFKTGFWAPDLADGPTVKSLAVWNGEWENLAILQFIRLTVNGEKQPSSFPPKGLS